MPGVPGLGDNNINYSPRTAQQKRRFTDGSGVNGEWMTQQNRYPGRQTSRWPYERHNNDYGSYPYHAHQSTDGAWNATGSSPSKAAESSSSANVDDAKRATSRELVAVPRAPLPLPVHGRRVDAEDEDINVDAEYLVREEDERDLERSPLMSRPEGSSARIQEVEDDVDVHPQQPEGQYPRSEPARPSVPPSEIDADDHRSHSVNRQLGFVPSDQFGTGVWESALIKKKI
ncbi:hypothetical protein BD410DRAFT_64820 [Rickenella mellea]|uniref:Uncharacterized protein n=1 Tax=Rickenella mellea TaxID=50990 RepID=A0A4Y7QCA3_9AGAM|nr:hypothetical protein BD410DRAFT_64820 [Rickenella mellea]